MPADLRRSRRSRVGPGLLHGAAIVALMAVSIACGADGPDGPMARQSAGIVAAEPPTPPEPAAPAAVADAAAGADGADAADGADDPALAAAGRDVALARGCAACHGGDFGGATGPTWIGLAGSTVVLADGREVVADDAYLRRAIVEPDADIVDGYIVKMPVVALDDAEIDAVIAFISSLGSGSE